jgi:SecD/SecF fusion protein
MTENLGRKLTLILVLVALAGLCLFVPEKPLRLGLDLQGGTRLQYRFDFDAALAAGKISQGEYTDRGQMLQAFCDIIRGRVDPQGVMELGIRPEGTDRITIELPGAAELSSSKTSSRLVAGLPVEATEITLQASDTEAIKSFPLGGGLVRIGSEKISYATRTGAVLSGLGRGAEKTTAQAHEAGASVELLTSDDLQKRIENVGDLQFLIAAKESDVQPFNTDLTKEREKVIAWIDAHPGTSLEAFNRLPAEKGGPVQNLRWYPSRIPKGELETPIKTRLQPLVLPDPKWIFSGNDLESVNQVPDDLGYPAVAFEITIEKKAAFGDFTDAHLKEGMAIVLNGEIATLATINEKLPGSGRISGHNGFTQKEVKDLLTVLRSGSLRIRPELLAKERVGASLGDDYIANSFTSSMVALGIIAVFMIAFYRRLGVFAVIGLVINLFLLMGCLAFLKATLTLPGIAGIILTLGMAVDGNILIFERLREEKQRGLKLVQAAKAAFERAGVTIIDSNLTTLIAGIILYNVGSGPIRGFATTLNIGILTTLFTVIVVSRTLVFMDIKRGRSGYDMMDMFKAPKFKFMNFSKVAVVFSSVLILAGMWLFASLPDREKLGIDFLGGFTMTVRTQEPQPVDKIRELVSTIPGTIGRSAEVKPKLDSGSNAAGFTDFRITYKLAGDEAVPSDSPTGETGEKEVRDALASVLQRGPVVVDLTTADAVTRVEGELYFEHTHLPADVQAVLGTAGLKDVTVEPLGRPEVFKFAGTLEDSVPQDDLAQDIQSKFEGVKDSRGQVYSPRSPVPETALVGAQVGSELRDKAGLALLLSLAATILYLRVRFADYSYGIAVVVALVHDVLIALGACALATKTGLIQAEIDLSMVAAFLTIVGFSQNDTIVIFDRLRENLPKSKGTLREILDDSLNQTLARTLLTTLTVLMTLIVLFMFNVGSRNVLEGFSYAMIAGVISGVYSTVYVAGPVLLLCDKLAATRQSTKTPPTAGTGNPTREAKAKAPAA